MDNNWIPSASFSRNYRICMRETGRLQRETLKDSGDDCKTTTTTPTPSLILEKDKYDLQNNHEDNNIMDIKDITALTAANNLPTQNHRIL